MGALKRHSTTLDESVRYSLAINPQFELGIELGIEETYFSARRILWHGL